MSKKIERKEFLKTVEIESEAKKETAQEVKKKDLREELEDELAKFLKRGGKVKPLPGCVLKPRPMRSVVESKQTGYASKNQVIALVRWANESKTKKPRRNYMAELTGIPLKRIRSCITPGRNSLLTKFEYKEIIAVMDQVEQLESLEMRKAA